jgi:radical SAM superfamily enzyme YgiQ (UPF0313 family)
MGPYRTKPLEILEREIDQLSELYPGNFLQFTDDNLLANRAYRKELLALLRRKQRRFVTMVTVDQFCDGALMEEMASSGCLGVAVGVESVDDDNCASVSKYQNLHQPFPDAVRHAHECGVQTAALLMVGLPHDTPERLARTLDYLKKIPCSLYDIRILRIYPSTPMYSQMLASGDVIENWWLEKESPETCNHLLPSCLSMHFKHKNFDSMQLQHIALQFTSELNRMTCESVARVLSTGARRGGLVLTGTLLYARRQAVKQAQTLQLQVEQSMSQRDINWALLPKLHSA